MWPCNDSPNSACTFIGAASGTFRTERCRRVGDASEQLASATKDSGSLRDTTLWVHAPTRQPAPHTAESYPLRPRSGAPGRFHAHQHRSSCPDCLMSEPRTQPAFFRRFFSSGGHRWQNRHACDAASLNRVKPCQPLPKCSSRSSTRDETPLRSCTAVRTTPVRSGSHHISRRRRRACSACAGFPLTVYPLQLQRGADGKNSRNLSSCAADPTEGTVMPPLNCEGGGGGSTSAEICWYTRTLRREVARSLRLAIGRFRRHQVQQHRGRLRRGLYKPKTSSHQTGYCSPPPSGKSRTRSCLPDKGF